MDKINCSKTFENSKWILSKSGLWVTKTITNRSVIKWIFNFFFDLTVSILVCYNITNAIQGRNINLLNRMICILIPVMNYLAKSFTLMINRRCFWSILSDLDSHVFNSHNELSNIHIQTIYRLSRIFSRYFILALTVYIVIGCILPMILNIELIIPAPFNSGRYDFLYKIAHLFVILYLAFNCVGFDMLYLTLLSLCVAQLNILESQLENIENTAQQNSNRECANLGVRIVLRDIVILHEKINQFVEKLSTLLSFPLFIQYMCGCFTICNTVLQVTILREPGSMETLSMCGYAGITFTQMVAYHWLGNELLFKSDKISEASYLSKWYQLDLKSQKLLLILMARANRSLIVKLYGYIFISLDSMGVIVRWAYSVFALIKARYG